MSNGQRVISCRESQATMTKRDVGAMLDFLSPLSIVPGMGPKRVAAFADAGMESVGDLLYNLPKRYIDRSTVTPIGHAARHTERPCTFVGTIETVRVERGRRQRLRALLRDDTGSMELLWFSGVSYYRQTIKKGQRLIVTGKVTLYRGVQMVHPTIDPAVRRDGAPLPFLPVYGMTSAMREAGAAQRFLRKSVRWLLDNCKHFPQSLPEAVESGRGFAPLATCLCELHFPSTLCGIEQYRDRIRYEELYRLALSLHFSRAGFREPGRSLRNTELTKRWRANLPFRLTADQESAIATLLEDAASHIRMHRLLQGDVGSGKTIVAFSASLPALGEGLQVVWMAPTEILARQTHQKINEWLGPLGLCAELLTAAAGPADGAALRRRIASGEARFIVGTHALLQPKISFRGVGIFVIDEQHRFGAGQRVALHEKDPRSDILLMSATPIPRTLAQTLYGDLDIVTIKSLPPGRRPVSTHLVPEAKRADMERFIMERISAGERCFYIVPRIESVECVDDDEAFSRPLRDIGTTFAALTQGPFSSVKAALVHGRLDSAQKEKVIGDFACGNVQLLVATSIIEVGIDVPQATVIVLENSERFGLAQLHQLRGRVGRGRGKSYCFLLTPEPADEATEERLRAFCSEHDGFALAELDLRLRGPGEAAGLRQSGWDDLTVADILRDAALFAEIMGEIEQRVGGCGASGARRRGT